VLSVLHDATRLFWQATPTSAAMNIRNPERQNIGLLNQPEFYGKYLEDPSVTKPKSLTSSFFFISISPISNIYPN